MMSCGPGVAGRIEINGKAAAGGAHSPKALKLAPNNILAEVHRKSFKDKDCG
jgi:hypothetical protein